MAVPASAIITTFFDTCYCQENDLKPEFKLKVAEWEVRKALAGHSNKVIIFCLPQQQGDNFLAQQQGYHFLPQQQNDHFFATATR